jgi:CRP/FNR family cyclic AMP-dependent transcriptional regulator
MISPEVIRRFPLSAGLNADQLTQLAMAAEELVVDEGHWFFRQDQELHAMYLVLEGQVGIVVELPRQEVLTSTVGPGEVFGWSGMVPPHETTAGARALSPCRVVRFDCRRVRQTFETDCRFGYIVMERMAQIVRQRMRDLRTEALPAYVS